MTKNCGTFYQVCPGMDRGNRCQNMSELGKEMRNTESKMRRDSLTNRKNNNLLHYFQQ